MSLRRLFALIRGLGYGASEVQNAPAAPMGEAGASGASVTSLREFARALGNPKEFIRG